MNDAPVFRKKKVVLILLLFSIAFFAVSGCGSSQDDAMMSEPASAPDLDISESASFTEEAAYDAAPQDPNTRRGMNVSDIPKTNHKIIYTGEISMETLTFDETIEKITHYVEKTGGYIENSSIEGHRIGNRSVQSKRYAHFTFRIPEQGFTGFADQMRDFGNVTAESTQGENITERYFDTEARLNSLTVQEERLLSLLEKADTIDDIMRIESELSNIRYQVESLTGTLQKWDHLVQYSTIYLSLREVDEITPDPTHPPGFLKDLQSALEDSILAVIESLKFVVTFIIMAVPFIIVFGLLFLLIKKFYRVVIEPRRKPKNQPPLPPKE
ncbi:protein of unknown function [Tindallia magadiensis]|uniref:DUF4349 domain-containing protein n=1 Tax=Tindallia magadiensis TaxID=69895 RepID=A0A1I3BBQ7_9FIRM|nr:DUF4349 domain-containing protein [Tindallia magadiensis]SFH59728.1 protein of unknown function [Tindallia magadiensis]